MSEEALRILKMVEEGKVSAEEAQKLLAAVEEDTSTEVEVSGRKPKWLKVQVYNGGPKAKVNVKIPLSLLKIAKKFIPRDAKAKINEADVDLDEIFEAIEHGEVGKLVEVEDGDDRVYVYVE
jgi:hypothetical protein